MTRSLSCAGAHSRQRETTLATPSRDFLRTWWQALFFPMPEAEAFEEKEEGKISIKKRVPPKTPQNPTPSLYHYTPPFLIAFSPLFLPTKGG